MAQRKASLLRRTQLRDDIDGYENNAVGLGDGLKVSKVVYDFTVDGGSGATITPAQTKIPAAALIVGGFMRVIAAITGGATLAVTLASAGDIVAAAADTGAPWSTTGKKAIVPKINTPESTSIGPLTTELPITFVRSVANITAGKVEVYLLYIPRTSIL